VPWGGLRAHRTVEGGKERNLWGRATDTGIMRPGTGVCVLDYLKEPFTLGTRVRVGGYKTKISVKTANVSTCTETP